MKNICLKKIHESIHSLTTDQLCNLLNVHSLFISKDKICTDHSSESNYSKPIRSIKNHIYSRIKQFTEEKDLPTVLSLIEMIQSNYPFSDIVKILFDIDLKD